MERFSKSDLLYLLKLEASLIEGGKFGRPVVTSGRLFTLMRDCVTCLNLFGTEQRYACASCFLIEHVPERLRGARLPCHHIPLNDQGETIAELDRLGRRDDAQRALLDWLRRLIHELEQEPDQH